MYIIDDSVLIPSFQYFLKQIKQNNEKCLPILEMYVAGTSKDKQEQLKCIIDVLKLYDTDRDKAKVQLENYVTKKHVCQLCVNDCQGCFRAFCYELLKYFYHEAKYDDIVYTSDTGRPNEKFFRFERFPENIERDLLASEDASKQYFEQYKRNQKERAITDRLIVLKGLSSSTPAVLNAAFSAQAYHGGGFYLNWKGFGIVIDPGYHFLYNLHKKGLTVLDINAVVITHEHIDHTNDIRLLDDLFDNQYSTYSSEISSCSGRKSEPISWYLDEVTMNMVDVFRKHKSGFKSEGYTFISVSPKGNSYKLYEHGDTIINMYVFPTEHEQIKRAGITEFQTHTFGTVFELISGTRIRRVFYSSDTKYNDNIRKAAEGADIIIANISSFYNTDLLLLLQKERHLGFKGCYELLRSMINNPPRVFLISEFWNGKSDVRFDVSKYLSVKINEIDDKAYKNTKIIPGEIGMEFDLDSCNLRCDSCGTFSEHTIVIRPEADNHQIRVICENCRF